MSHDTARLRGMRVLLLGLGTRQGGVGTARYLAEHGARVRVTDLRSRDQLADSLAELADLDITYTLGRHDDADLLRADMIVRNPGVPTAAPPLELARRLGKPIEMEMTLFFKACPAPIIGVTGTKGKTTTTTLIGEMLRQRWPEAIVAGNMAISALGQLEHAHVDVPVALEISSFQLEALDEHRLSPHVAVITNISPDHLDRYDSLDDYARTKSAIGRHQTEADWLVVPANDLRVGEVTSDSHAQRITFGAPAIHDNHLYVVDDRFQANWHGERLDLGPTSALRIAGEHSAGNVLAAAGAALAVGVSPDQIAAAVAGFGGVPHRMEHVATIDGVDYINDTAATAPAAAIAALRAFANRETILIAGGYDKHLPIETLADEIASRAAATVLLDGTMTPRLQALLQEREYAGLDGIVDSMAAAVVRARELARPGDVVLLSPGTASFGMFRDEFHRGEEFRAAVEALRQA